MPLKALLTATTPTRSTGWGGTRIGARSPRVLAIAKTRRPVSLVQAATICTQLGRLLASNPKLEYTPAEIKNYIGPVSHQVRGMVFAMLGWRYRSVRRNKHAVRIWAAPLSHEGHPMPADNPAIAAALALAEADRLKNKNVNLVELWLEAAGANLQRPNQTPRDFNRTGELLMAAGNWLTVERKRIADAERTRLHRIEAVSMDAAFKARNPGR